MIKNNSIWSIEQLSFVRALGCIVFVNNNLSSQWFVIWSAPTNYLNQCRLLIFYDWFKWDSKNSACVFSLPNLMCFEQKCAFSDARRIYHMMTSSNGNFYRVIGPLCGEFTGHRWIPLSKASDADAELGCFLWSAPEQTVDKTIEMPVIWDAIMLIMASL